MARRITFLWSSLLGLMVGFSLSVTVHQLPEYRSHYSLKPRMPQEELNVPLDFHYHGPCVIALLGAPTPHAGVFLTLQLSQDITIILWASWIL